MKPSNYEIPLRGILCFLKGMGLGRKKHIGTHKRPENGRGAWVALCAHPTHTDTDSDTSLR
jgi:hypothetical protein